MRLVFHSIEYSILENIVLRMEQLVSDTRMPRRAILTHAERERERFHDKIS